VPVESYTSPPQLEKLESVAERLAQAVYDKNTQAAVNLVIHTLLVEEQEQAKPKSVVSLVVEFPADVLSNGTNASVPTGCDSSWMRAKLTEIQVQLAESQGLAANEIDVVCRSAESDAVRRRARRSVSLDVQMPKSNAYSLVQRIQMGDTSSIGGASVSPSSVKSVSAAVPPEGLQEKREPLPRLPAADRRRPACVRCSHGAVAAQCQGPMRPPRRRVPVGRRGPRFRFARHGLRLRRGIGRRRTE
jgi:hypothetical protein